MTVRTSSGHGHRSPLTAITRALVLTCAAVAVSAGPGAQAPPSVNPRTDTAGLPERVWRDPGNVAALNLITGAGGSAHKPNPAGVFTFVSEDAAASSPKFDVTDAKGTLWKVKLGDESQAETAATRFLWAAGYLTDEDYYVERLTVKGLPTLRRGQDQVSAGGVVRGARLERIRAPGTKLGHWDWFDNPFVGTRELNGLRVMMSLLNSWDLKDVNNAVYVVKGERQYTVSDLGSTFGKTGSAWARTKGKPADYEDSKFIANVEPGFIDFVLVSRPNVFGAFDPVNYRERTNMENITKHIPRSDVRWLAARLSRLTSSQIRDAFRAAGFDAESVDTLAGAFRLRIAALKAL